MTRILQRNQWHHPVMIPPARRHSTQEILEMRRRRARSSLLPVPVVERSASRWPLWRVAIVSCLAGAALALLLSVDGWG